MRLGYRLPLFCMVLTSFLAACAHPISQEARAKIDSKIDLAMVSENPSAFLEQQLLIGGVVLSLENSEKNSTLQIMEWRLNRWGEPTYLDDAGRRVLVKSAEALDPEFYQVGTLVTLAGVVVGQEARPLGEHEYIYPVFNLIEIHLWESPFRYGIHSNPDPAYPYFIDQREDAHSHPYDPGYNPYPYTQHWYRDTIR